MRKMEKKGLRKTMSKMVHKPNKRVNKIQQ